MTTRNPAKRNQRFIAWGTAAASIAITLVVLLLFPDQPAADDVPDSADPEREVNVTTFKPEDIRTEIRITGRIRAVERIDLYSEVQGVLITGARPFRTGNRFEKDEVLVQLDDQDEALDLFAQRSRFQASIAALLPSLRTDFPDYFESWAAYVDTIDPERTLDDLPEIDDRQLRFFISANEVYSQFYSIRALESRVARYTLKAPFSGELRQADVHPGALIQPNARLGEFIGDVYELETFLSINELPYVSRGDEVTLRSRAGDNLTGTITRTGRSVDPGTQSFPVYVELESPELRDGLYFEGSIRGRTLENAVEIPRNLLTRENTVLIIDDGLATHREVEPLFFNRSTVIVRGLDEEDQVIELRAGSASLAGARVTARNND